MENVSFETNILCVCPLFLYLPMKLIIQTVSTVRTIITKELLSYAVQLLKWSVCNHLGLCFEK